LDVSLENNDCQLPERAFWADDCPKIHEQTMRKAVDAYFAFFHQNRVV
jgi:hypothetical protein